MEFGRLTYGGVGEVAGEPIAKPANRSVVVFKWRFISISLVRQADEYKEGDCPLAHMTDHRIYRGWDYQDPEAQIVGKSRKHIRKYTFNLFAPYIHNWIKRLSYKPKTNLPLTNEVRIQGGIHRW